MRCYVLTFGSILGFALSIVACSSSDPTTRPGVGGADQGTGGASGASNTGGAPGTGGSGGGGAVGGNANGGSANGGGGSASTGGGAGSSGGGGGLADAAMGSGGGDAGGAEAGAVAAVVSDNFEATAANGPPDPAKWTVDLMNGNGIVTVDATVSHIGRQSLHVNGNNAYHTMAMVKGAPLFPAPGNKFFGRVWLRLPGPMPQGHVIWIEAGTVMNDVKEIRIGSNNVNNVSQLDVNQWDNAQGAPTDKEQRAPSARLMPATWSCIEFMFDGGGSEARVWQDGTELTDLHVTNWVAPNPANGNNTTPIPNWAPTFEAVRLGWELGSASEIWFDDVAFGYQRIGCQ